jgi:spoIIIJ-associated protein
MHPAETFRLAQTKTSEDDDMEWVETTGKTVDEATELALDQLGVAKDEADIEVLEEGKTGLFGRVRLEARVRARVRPATPRAKEERRDRTKRAPKAKEASVSASDALAEKAPKKAAAPKAKKDLTADSVSPDTVARETVADDRPRRAKPVRAAGSSAILPGQPTDPEVHRVGSEFLEGLLESFDLDATVTSSVVSEGHTEFKVSGSDLGVLIGPKALTLAAIQDLLRTIIHYGIPTDSGRILLDIAGYRERRRIALQNFAQQVAAQVVESGEVRSMEPMSPADRKVVHDAINGIDGVQSSSEGEEPNRRVVLLPA